MSKIKKLFMSILFGFGVTTTLLCIFFACVAVAVGLALIIPGVVEFVCKLGIWGWNGVLFVVISVAIGINDYRSIKEKGE